jgi:hypothetical protein
MGLKVTDPGSIGVWIWDNRWPFMGPKVCGYGTQVTIHGTDVDGSPWDR